MSFFRQFPKAQYDFNDTGINTTITNIFRYVQADLAKIDDIVAYEYYRINDGDRPDVVSNLLYGTPDYYWTFFLCNEHLKKGMKEWPLSQVEFDSFIDEEYSGTALITNPFVEWNNDFTSVNNYRDSLAGRFTIGDTITGSSSGATGLLYKKDSQLSQLIVRNVNGTFRKEQVIGTDDQDSVYVNKAMPWRDAPHHYLNGAGTISYNSLYINEQQPALGSSNPAGVSDTDLTAVSNYNYELSLNDERANIRIVRPSHIYEFAQKVRTLLNG